MRFLAGDEVDAVSVDSLDPDGGVKLPRYAICRNDNKCLNVWMTGSFMALPTVFQSY